MGNSSLNLVVLEFMPCDATINFVMTKYENKKKILLYYWLFIGTCHKNLVIWKPFFSKSSKVGPFFPWKIFCIGQITFFRSKFGKKSP
jgi:uncharacterized PurR-regulated membrane protein YhhQ (DUF165 family)